MALKGQDKILPVCKMISTAITDRLKELGLSKARFCNMHKDVVNRPTFDRICSGANATNFATLFNYLNLLGLTVSITKESTLAEMAAQNHVKDLLFSPAMSWDDILVKMGEVYSLGFNAGLDSGWIDPTCATPRKDCEVLAQTRPKNSKTIADIVIRIIRYDLKHKRFVVAESVDVMYWQHLPKSKI